MTHDRCSELLSGYLRGELPSEEAEEVRTHLESCDDCRAEERAVAALMTADETPLDDVERARLHRGLAQELFTTRANADVAGAAPAGPDWRRWIAPAFASAAVLAGILALTLGGGTDDAAQVEQLSAPEREELRDRDGGSDSAESGAGGGAASKPGRALSGEASAHGSATEFAGGPQPVFLANAGRLTAKDLSEAGRTEEPFVSFVRAYSPGDGPDLYAAFLRSLAGAAGGTGPDIRECAATLPQDGTLLPAYAALARYEGEDALVLGFVTADPGSRRFDRYLMWVWERGSCRQPIDTLFEEIDEP
ncbi:MAG: zf-HC2 domain-containing protein [Actinomycetota bacterium]|nr:zf-HC2 domain-containing protein [Actinomycetota bacterium]